MQEINIQHNPYDRVRNLSPEKLNKKIDKKTNQLLHGIVSQGADAVRARIKKLDKEWDIDRAVMLISSTVIFSQLISAYKRRNKNMLWGPLIHSPLLFMHATLGWCPAVPVLRQLGFRTRFEIEEEKDELIRVLAHEDPLSEWQVYGKG
ncbi:MAG: hypothetical protein WC635_11375 [Bacteriovorax sp.]|jgi:hypothetical protein